MADQKPAPLLGKMNYRIKELSNYRHFTLTNVEIPAHPIAATP
jgi:hypothetical protein